MSRPSKRCRPLVPRGVLSKVLEFAESNEVVAEYLHVLTLRTPRVIVFTIKNADARCEDEQITAAKTMMIVEERRTIADMSLNIYSDTAELKDLALA
jgi:hypothetical protein